MGKLHILKTSKRRILTLEEMYEIQLGEYIEVATELINLLKKIQESKFQTSSKKDNKEGE